MIDPIEQELEKELGFRYEQEGAGAYAEHRDLARYRSASTREWTLWQALVSARRELAEEQRRKYGTPCKCETWIETCGKLEAELSSLKSGELVKALEEYVEFLGKEIDGNAGFMFVHGMQCSDEKYKKGCELRARIAQLKGGSKP